MTNLLSKRDCLFLFRHVSTSPQEKKAEKEESKEVLGICACIKLG